MEKLCGKVYMETGVLPCVNNGGQFRVVPETLSVWLQLESDK